MKNKERLGEINKNKFGTEMKIIEYNGCSDIIVEFQDEYKTKVHTSYQCFKNGEVKNPYDKTIYNVGYIGVGNYKVSDKRKVTIQYKKWHMMLNRCYEPYELNKYPTYIDVDVCEEWLCFQNFAKWFDENYNEIEGEKMDLDKDILFKGNKVYSPETCCYVPRRINVLIVKRDLDRGGLPLGVSKCEKENVFRARCCIIDEDGKGKTIHLGRFDNEIDAFIAYKTFKEAYIKQIASEYRDKLPERVYNALINWKVEIND